MGRIHAIITPSSNRVYGPQAGVVRDELVLRHQSRSPFSRVEMTQQIGESSVTYVRWTRKSCRLKSPPPLGKHQVPSRAQNLTANGPTHRLHAMSRVCRTVVQ